MKKWNKETGYKVRAGALCKQMGMGRCVGRKVVAAAVLTLCLTGCGNAQKQGEAINEDSGMLTEDAAEAELEDGMENADTEHIGEDTAAANDDKAGTAGGDGIGDESAADTRIDFSALQEKNPEIFAWLYVPGTEIDVPVLQSMQGDDYYETHNADGEEDTDGAVYIELANVADMCDFNTVIHGKTGIGETGPFSDLYRFADPDFFKEHEQFYLYLDGNVLTYEIFAAYERENTSLLREYDFTYYIGCKQFLDDLYDTRDLGMNLREGWEGLTPYQFLVTLTTQKEVSDDKQMVVVAVLTADAAGTVNRIVAE